MTMRNNHGGDDHAGDIDGDDYSHADCSND